MFKRIDIENRDLPAPVQFDKAGGRERGKASTQGLRRRASLTCGITLDAPVTFKEDIAIVAI